MQIADAPIKIEKATQSRSVVQLVLPYIAILGTLYTLYLTKTILLPVVVAAFIALFSSPLVERLEKINIPRQVGSVCVLSAIIAVVVLVGIMFTGPAQQWWSKAPNVVAEFSQQFSGLNVDSQGDGQEGTKVKPIGDEAADSAASNMKQAQADLQKTTALAIFKSIASATPTVVTQFLATIFLVYFFLVYGHLLLLRLIQIQSSFKDKRQAVELVNTMQHELSRYVYTISLINVGLAVVVGCVFYALGVEDAFLWGALAGVLNFAPYVGPLISAATFAVISYLHFGEIEMALIVPGVYLAINLIESQFVTPTLLGGALDLNPLVVFLWLLLWGWIWGVFGMLVGVPLLVCLVIYLERTGIVGDWYMLVKHRDIS